MSVRAVRRATSRVGAAAFAAAVAVAVWLPATPSSRASPHGRDASVDIVGAGDIGWCGSPGPAATAALLDAIPGTVFTTGDNAYPSGTSTDFADCYDPSWGRHRGRTRPSPGNHDYGTAGAAAYFAYFGAAAGQPGTGYYSYDLGDWHVVVLDSNVAMDAGSAQIAWLRADLAASAASCTLAYWHHPLFSSGPHGNDARSLEAWRVLHEFRADVVLNGHDHHYERFALQDPDGTADPVRGIRQFIVGTGGAPLRAIVTSAPNSEVSSSADFGVLRLTLESSSYRWEFVPVVGGTFHDTGTGTCVSPSSPPPAPPPSPPVPRGTEGVLDWGSRPLDLDGDGRGDGVRYDAVDGGATLDLQSGARVPQPILTASSTESWSPGWTIKAGDLDGDGRSDLFFYDAAAGYWYTALARSVGGAPRFDIHGGRWSPGWSIALLELDGDGRDDVFVYDPAGGDWYRAVSRAGGSPGFTLAGGRWSPGWQLHVVELDGDGRHDLLLYRHDTGAWYRVMNDGASFTYVGGSWSPGWEITPGDHTGDGLSDLLLYDPADGHWFVAINTGAGWTYRSGRWSPGWRASTGDLNGDGRADVFLYDAATGAWFQCFSNGDGTFQYVGGTWAPGWEVRLSSFDLDDLADVLLYSPANGVFSQGTNDGPGAFSFRSGQWEHGRTIVATHAAP